MPSHSPFHVFVQATALSVACTFSYWATSKSVDASDSFATRTPPPQKWDSETERLFEGNPQRRLRGARPERKASVTAQPGAREEDVSPLAWETLIPTETVGSLLK